LSIGYLGTDGLAREEQPEPILEKFDLPQPDVPVPQSRGEDDLVTPSRVRQFFPETWLWSEHMLGEDESSVVEKVIVPDTITSWVADAFAVSATQAMTIAHPTTLTVFQPFFVTINLPYSVIRGELVEITVTVFNYLQDETTAYVDLNVNEDEMRVAIGKQNRKQLQSGSRPLEVPPGEGKATTYYLLPLRNGYVPIQATVRSQTAADSVIRHLLVEVFF
jgi:CD109 antigen